jgi:hypothetical protein
MVYPAGCWLPGAMLAAWGKHAKQLLDGRRPPRITSDLGTTRVSEAHPTLLATLHSSPRISLASGLDGHFTVGPLRLTHPTLLLNVRNGRELNHRAGGQAGSAARNGGCTPIAGALTQKVVVLPSIAFGCEAAHKCRLSEYNP